MIVDRLDARLKRRIRIVSAQNLELVVERAARQFCRAQQQRQ
ncbi:MULTISPECIES: hypothetical protein [Vreelandella]|jgi:hypothetical protein|uniref:Uncharacterized protein n=1 Tax=Vreelandella sp. SM1641 TaxID=3126101 RepID=A0AAU7XLH3_9GAMM|nr:hypothetical protein [Halomonas titanicae]|tara:strand:- start:1009 stop:1134 length:126 start_codon:yes stop_codon:yes gene_type:complete